MFALLHPFRALRHGFARQKHQRRLALAALLVATFCANTTPVFSKLLLADGWTPVSLYFLTLLVMTIFLAVHEFIALERGERWGMDRRDVVGMLLTTLTGGVISPLLFFSGIELVAAAESVLLTSLLPFFIVIFAVVFLKETFSMTTLGGGVFLMFGILVMLWEDIAAANVGPGAVLLVSSSIFGALTTIVHKKFVQHRHLDSIVLVRSLLSLLMVGLWLYVTEPQSFEVLVTPQNVWLVLGLPLVGFLLPFFFYFRGLVHLKALEAGLIATTGPIFGVLLASAFLHEEITPAHLLSLGFIAVGIIFINVPLTKWRIVPSRLIEMGPLRK